ncbi:MAG: NADH-ubiquinone/plastoquinone oxidoreductase subunit 6 [Acidobacteria bacterium]|nr:MAG: NADH-ubiquinone/plastoquinone oxidoreductase subunit 6 [Acidobacteriota bacterium]
MLAQGVFFILAAVALSSGVMVITRRNPIHSVLWLIVTLFSVGGIFLLQYAQFLFAVQIILYVGGIMVLYLFVIMLIRVETVVKQPPFSRQWPIGLAAVVVLAGELVWGIVKGAPSFRLSAPAQAGIDLRNTESLASVLYGNYLLPVEIASLLLLVAMVGAVLMAKKRFD